MARDNSRVAQALFIIAREHSGPSAKWERTLSRRLAVATAAAGSCKSFSTYSPGADNRKLSRTWPREIAPMVSAHA